MGFSFKIKYLLPPWIRFLFRESEKKDLGIGILGLFIGVLIISSGLWIGPRWLGGILSACSVLICWRLSLGDLLGRILFIWGRIHLNESRECTARIFLLTSVPLRAVVTQSCLIYYSSFHGVKDMRLLENALHISLWARDRNYWLGICLLGQGQHDKGMEALIRYREKGKDPSLVRNAGIEISRMLLKMGRPKEALTYLPLGDLEVMTDEAVGLRGRIHIALGQWELADRCLDEAIRIRGQYSEYHLLKAQCLLGKGLPLQAMSSIDRSLDLHDKEPHAHFLMGLIHLRSGAENLAENCFRKACHYDNNRTVAFLLAESIRQAWTRGLTMPNKRMTSLEIIAPQIIPSIKKGEIRSVEIIVRCGEGIKEVYLALLQPYGYGIRVEPDRLFLGSLNAGEAKSVTISLVGVRSNEVNLGKPWAVNVVLYSHKYWNSKIIEVEVRDEEPGEILFSISEDHETGPRWGPDRNERSIGVPVWQARMDLIEKSRFACRMGERYGIHWTHMIDVGTSLGLIRWAGGKSSEWGKLWKELSCHFDEMLENGHDIQLHLHLSALPESYFFCYDYDPAEDRVTFNLEKKNRYFPGWQINSWANVVPESGDIHNVNTREGSLFHAKKILEKCLLPGHWDRKVVLFRAGQWDMGKNGAELEKSITALKDCGILADSSVTEGRSYYESDFSFGSSPRRAARFTRRNNPEDFPSDLHETGIMIFLPILNRYGKHPVTPRTPGKWIKRALSAFQVKGKILSGIHPVMEMEHIVTLNKDKKNRDLLQEGYGDWKRIEKQFRFLHRLTGGIRFVGAEESVLKWMEYYSPDLFILLKFSREDRLELENLLQLEYSISFLGSGVIGKTRNYFPVQLVFPSLFCGVRSEILVLEGESIIFRKNAPIKSRYTVWIELGEENQGRFRFICRIPFEEAIF